jgi:CheY-like chemotaxis protein
MARRILVVDDDPGVRDVVTLVLGDEGFPVATAADGRQALASIAAERPDLVLLDLNMPEMTGWEVLSQLQAERAGIPVVLLTAEQGGQAEAQRCHADGYLGKPFDIADLLTVVERCLRLGSAT